MRWPRLSGPDPGPGQGAVIVLAALLAACSADADAAGATGEAATGTATGGTNPTTVVRVAAAADLKFAFDEVADLVREQRPDIQLTTTYGSSGTFLQQIRNGAPFDLYLSADLGYPRQLVEAGLADEADLFPYAVGRLVLWVPEGSSLNPDDGLTVLTDPAVRRVAIANPEHAPYGRAAVAAMQSAGIADAVEPTLVLGENVAQAAEFVASGNADAGIVALSLVLSPALRDQGTWSEIPLDSFPRLEQGGVVLARAEHADAARAVRDVLLGEEGRAILRSYGFSSQTDEMEQ